MSLPVPMGCISPFLQLGALLGRLVGLFYISTVNYISYSLLGSMIYDTPALVAFELCRCSLLGAGAFAASGLRAFSVVVSLAELVFLPGLSTQLIITTIVAMGCSYIICSLSILDSIVKMRKLPVQPGLLPVFNKSVGELAVRDATQLQRFVSIRELWLQFVLNKKLRRRTEALAITHYGNVVGQIYVGSVLHFLRQHGFFLRREEYPNPFLYDLLYDGAGDGAGGSVQVVLVPARGSPVSRAGGTRSAGEAAGTERGQVLSWRRDERPSSPEPRGSAGTGVSSQNGDGLISSVRTPSTVVLSEAETEVVEVSGAELLQEIEKEVDLLRILDSVQVPVVLPASTSANEAYTLMHFRKTEHAFVVQKGISSKTAVSLLKDDDPLFGHLDHTERLLGRVTLESLVKS